MSGGDKGDNGMAPCYEHQAIPVLDAGPYLLEHAPTNFGHPPRAWAPHPAKSLFLARPFGAEIAVVGGELVLVWGVVNKLVSD